jgi:hypothetical protein
VKNHQTVSLLLLLCCPCLCSPRSVADEAALNVPFCDLVAMPQQYDTKAVVTEALIRSSEHEVHVYNESRKSTLGNDRSELPAGWNSTKLGKKLSGILRHHRAAIVRFEAVFKSGRGPFGQEKTRFRFLLQRLTSVEQLSRYDNGRVAQPLSSPAS